MKTFARKFPNRPLAAKRFCRGVTLVELIVAMVVFAVVCAGLASGFATATRSSPLSKEMHQALQLAQGRMELILYQRQKLGFAGFVAATFDPCTAAGGGAQQACQTPAGFSPPNVTLTPNWNGDANYKVVTVTVSGPPDGSQLVRLDALVANY